MLRTMRRNTRLGAVLVAVALAAAQPAFAQESGRSSGDGAAIHQYEVEKADAWGPFALNFLLAFGIGSFVQGDTTGGLIVASGEMVGMGMMIIGGSSVAQDPEGPGGITLVVGVGLLAAARVAGLVFPFTYAQAFNEQLRRDLGIAASDISLTEIDRYGVNVAFTLEL